MGLAVVTGVGDETVAEHVPARALGFGDGLRRPGVALATVHVVAGEPAHAAQQRQRNLGPILAPQHLVLRQSPVRQHHPLLPIAHVYEGPLWMGGHRLPGPGIGPSRHIQRPLDDVEVTVGEGSVHCQAGGEVGAESVITDLVLDRRLEVHAAHAGGESDTGDDGERYRLIFAAGAVL